MTEDNLRHLEFLRPMRQFCEVLSLCKKIVINNFATQVHTTFPKPVVIDVLRGKVATKIELSSPKV
jgi:hypothetical protein